MRVLCQRRMLRWVPYRRDFSSPFSTKGDLQSTGAGRLPPRIVEPEVEEDDGAAEREAEERATAERAEQEAKEARERKAKQEQEQRARAAAAAAEAKRKRKEREKQDREAREREELARREREEEEADEARRERRAARAAAKAARSSKSSSEGRKSVERRANCRSYFDLGLTAPSRSSPGPRWEEETFCETTPFCLRSLCQVHVLPPSSRLCGLHL